MADPGAQLDIFQLANGWRLEGELDAHTAPSLMSAMSALPAGEVVVEVRGVSFVDSSGLRVLLEATNRARSSGGEVVIVGPQAPIKRLIEISGLSDHVRVRD